MNIEECLEKMKNNISSEDLFKDAVYESKKVMDELNPYVTIMNDYDHVESDSLINGVVYALKITLVQKVFLQLAQVIY